jgi:tetratricopeptide (TPR) repeat protein
MAAAPSIVTLPQALPSPSSENSPPAGIDPRDLTTAELIGGRLRAGVVQPSDIRDAEDLLARYPDERPLRDLLEAVLVASADRERSARRFAEAAALLRRAAAVQPRSRVPRVALAMLMVETGDWTAAEAAARDALSLDPRDAEALHTLGYALFRQDRNVEAADVLESALELSENAQSRSILGRIRKARADETGMREQRLSRFHVRYDGEEHESVGREILRALERHFSTLVATLDYEPQNAIPVILFSRERYYDAAGAPRWSGGVFDLIDGRIRIPIAGLTSSLSPDIDRTLIHELTHAFLAERTRGVAPREIHEGLAQVMEGKRLEAMLEPRELEALAGGGFGGVGGFYMGALSFVEHLLGSRGQSGMNEALRVMGETGNLDLAFEQVYGDSYATVRQAWQTRLRQRYGR